MAVWDTSSSSQATAPMRGVGGCCIAVKQEREAPLPTVVIFLSTGASSGLCAVLVFAPAAVCLRKLA